MEPVETAVERLQKELDRLVPRAHNNAISNVRLDGSGNVWGALSVGIALGAAIVCTMWVGSKLATIEEIQRNNEAFIQATYQQAPQIRDTFEKIRKEQESKQ